MFSDKYVLFGIITVSIIVVQAYDSVSRPELWAKLRRMGLGGSFVSMIQVGMYIGVYFLASSK